MRVILVNTNASIFMGDSNLLVEIERLCHDGWAEMWATSQVSEVSERFKDASVPIEDLVIVGGDGTFRGVLDVVMGLDPLRRPRLTPVGGGGFSYVARFAGFANDPLTNLKRIKAGEICVERLWRPLRIENDTQRSVSYGALYADGVIAEFVELYHQTGKGGVLTVLTLIFQVAYRAFVHGDYGPFRTVCGALAVDGMTVAASRATTVFSVIPSPMPGSRPFAGTPRETEFYFFTWWHTLGHAVCAIPWIWFGQPLDWISGGRFLNAPIRYAALRHDGGMPTVDGDILPVQQGDWFRITTGDELVLMCRP